MYGIKKLALGLLASLSLALFAGSVAADPVQDNVKAGVKALKEKLESFGAPRVEGGNLFFGSRKVNDDTEVVDGLKEKMGVAATVFIKQDAKFVRISTNIMRDGKRAVGTDLDPKGAAYPVVSGGQTFTGKVDILGKPYETVYEPIFDANKKVVGIYLVGLPVAQ